MRNKLFQTILGILLNTAKTIIGNVFSARLIHLDLVLIARNRPAWELA